jgi:hypothetical protein
LFVGRARQSDVCFGIFRSPQAFARVALLGPGGGAKVLGRSLALPLRKFILKFLDLRKFYGKFLDPIDLTHQQVRRILSIQV